MQSRLTTGLPVAVRDSFPSLTTDAQRAIAFVRSLPGVTCALVGMRTLRSRQREHRRGSAVNVDELSADAREARVRQSVIGEGEAFHRTSPDGDRGEKADLHSPARFTMIARYVTLTESWRLLRITQYADEASPTFHLTFSSIDCTTLRSRPLLPFSDNSHRGRR